MGKTKKKSAQNPNVAVKQSIDRIKSGSVKKNKNLKLKGTSEGKIALINNSKMQNKNKLSQKTTDTKNNQNLLQDNKKELNGEQYSMKRKKNGSNKSQNKSVNKKMKEKKLKVNNAKSLDWQKKKSEVGDGPDVDKSLTDESEEDSSSSNMDDISSVLSDDSWSFATDKELANEKEKLKQKQMIEHEHAKVFTGKKSKIEEDNSNDSDSSSSWVLSDDEKEEDDVPDILGKSLPDESEEDDEDFEDADDKDEDEVDDDDEDKDKDKDKDCKGEDVEDKDSKNKNEKKLDKFVNEGSDYDDDEDDDERDEEDDDERDEEDDDIDEEEYKSDDGSIDVRELQTMPEIENGQYSFSPDGNVNRTTIKVERLPNSITEEEIKSKFLEFGTITNIVFRTERKCKNEFNQNHHPYFEVSALIEFKSPISARRAYSMQGKEIGGRKIIVQYVDNPNLRPIFDSSKCIWVGKLSMGIDSNTIWKIFNGCGDIECVKLFRYSSGHTNGYACVVYETQDAVERALELNGCMIFNRQVEVRTSASIHKEIENAKEIKKVKDAEKLQGKSNDNNPSKKFKTNSGDAVTRKVEDKKQQIPQKSNGLVEKTSTSFQGQKANLKQKKKNKKFNKQKMQMAKKLAAKLNKPAKV
nr:PREDICTED: nucleolin-like isoform X1 [Linepithema humile]XP_012216694.1 PREDICTED: nucleolin-like isoform X1 [Linepithema humile]